MSKVPILTLRLVCYLIIAYHISSLLRKGTDCYSFLVGVWVVCRKSVGSNLYKKVKNKEKQV